MLMCDYSSGVDTMGTLAYMLLRGYIYKYNLVGEVGSNPRIHCEAHLYTNYSRLVDPMSTRGLYSM